MSLPLQQLAAVGQLILDFLQSLFQVAALLFQCAAMLFQHIDVVLQLRAGAVGRGIIHVDEIQDFRELEAHALAAQRQFQAGTIARMIDAVTAFAGGAHNALIFVEADGARRDAEFPGELGYRPSGGGTLAPLGVRSVCRRRDGF